MDATIGSIVEVKWLDITGVNDEFPEHKLLHMTPMEFSSYGVLLDDKPGHIVIASDEFFDDDEMRKFYRNTQAIPRGCLVKVIKLEEVQE
jgi:hypothetical protein